MLVVLGPVMSQFVGMQKSLAIGTVAALGAFLLTILFTRWDRLRLAAVGANIEWRSPQSLRHRIQLLVCSSSEFGRVLFTRLATCTGNVQ